MLSLRDQLINALTPLCERYPDVEPHLTKIKGEELADDDYFAVVQHVLHLVLSVPGLVKETQSELCQLNQECAKHIGVTKNSTRKLTR